jgi:Uma2 family endonuclease
MSTAPRALQEITFAAAARDYLRSLPLEHFMEATPQATQRAITLASLALVHARRPEVQVFNELLIQYRRRGSREILRVVPDNMVVLWEEPIQAVGSYDLPLQPTKPYWVLEYVSKGSERKDYEDSHAKYEHDLKVPFFLLFYPDIQDLTLYKHNRRKYTTVLPNRHGRYPIPDLELELGVVDGWVRYWFRGELLPLPAEMQQELDATRRQLIEEQRRTEEQKQRVEQEKQRAEQEKQRAEEEKQRAEQLAQQVAQAEQARTKLERELERLRAELARREASGS